MSALSGRQSTSRGIAMIRKARLFTPGPTPLLPAAQNAIAAADMHHRTAEFREIFSRTLADLKTFIGTNNDVLILASSGTGAMEAAVSNLTSPGEKVLVLSAGKFGERWRDLAKAYGCEIEILSVPTARPSTCAKCSRSSMARACSTCRLQKPPPA